MSALDKKKTFTSMQFVNLVETDMSIRSAKKQTMFTTNNMADYNMGFWRWKHSYRTRYSEKFLARYGFEAKTEGTAIVIDEDKIDEYLLTIDAEFDKTKSTSFGIAELSTQMSYYMQENGYDWSNKDGSLLEAGEVYEPVYYSYLENDDPNIPDDETKIVGVFECISDDTLDDFILEIDNVYGIDTTLTATYYRTTDPDEWYIYIEFVDMLPDNLWAEENMLLTPVVQLKKNGVLIPETKSMRKMMGKLNVDADDFEENLTKTDKDGEPEIDNAYIMNGLPLKNPYELRVGSYSPSESESLNVRVIQKCMKTGNGTEPEPEEPVVPPDDSDYGDNYNPDGNNMLDRINGGIKTPANDKAYTITQEIADWWYNENMREQAYLARALFRTFAYYAGVYKPECGLKKSNPRYLGDCVDDVVFKGTEQTAEEMHFGIGTGKIQVGLSSSNTLDMIHRYDMSVETFSGRVRANTSDKRSQCTFHFSGAEISIKDDEGKRHRTDTPDSLGYDLLEIKVQINEDQYQVMKITNYSNTFGISGRGFRNSLGSPQQEHRLTIPYFVSQNLKFTEYVTVHEHSFVLLAYAIKTVVTKWYKRFAGVFLAAIFCIGTLGAGCGAAMLITKVIIAVAVTLMMEFIMEHVDAGVFSIILQILVILIQMYLGGFDFSDLTVENYLKLANAVSKPVIGYFEMEAMKAEAEREKQEKAEENIQEKLGYADSAMSPHPKAMMSAHYSFAETNSPQALYSQLLGDQLFNFDQFYDVDEQLEVRKQVKSG